MGKSRSPSPRYHDDDDEKKHRKKKHDKYKHDEGDESGREYKQRKKREKEERKRREEYGDSGDSSRQYGHGHTNSSYGGSGRYGDSSQYGSTQGASSYGYGQSGGSSYGGDQNYGSAGQYEQRHSYSEQQSYGGNTYGGQAYSQPPAQYGGYQQSPAQHGGYNQPPPPAQYGSGYQQQSSQYSEYSQPPPPRQYSEQYAQGAGHYGGYNPPPPSTSLGYGQQSIRHDSQSNPHVHHETTSFSYGGSTGYVPRPDYGRQDDVYRPHHHSTAQEATTTGGDKPYFGQEAEDNATPSGSATKPPKKSDCGVLSTFTTELNSALHDYARKLIPATSAYNHGVASYGTGDDSEVTGNRFDSFAPVRNGNGIKFYVDGKDYMWGVSVALEKAQESIFILDWWLSPELYLRRPPSYHEQYRLDRMLQAAAARGVKVYIIVYKEVTQALTLNSAHTKHHLEDLHPNIVVMRHPDHLPDRDNVIRNTFNKLKSGTYSLGDGLKGIYGMKDDITLYFAHHEKLCVIDGEIAFMGGLDLCFGRWDTNEHPIADAHPKDLRAIVVPGQDYNNARYMDFQHVEKWQENAVSRLEISRMGWSDVAVSLMGPAVEDLQHHFVQRWNYIYRDKYDARNQPKYQPLDESKFKGGHGYHRRNLREKAHEVKSQLREGRSSYEEPYRGYERPDSEPEGVRLQICRSISKWSQGTKGTEHSIANAYIEIISTAKYFVYMENQFFITATDPQQKPILNMIGRAIVDRIIRAAHNRERFRIVVVIPAVPGFAGDLQSDDALGTRAIMEFQYRSINNDRGLSIMEQVQKAGIDPTEYIRFYNLRSYDRINSAGAYEMQQASGVSYDDAAGVHDNIVGGGWGGSHRGDEYSRYQQHAPKSGTKWDSVAKCVMLGGGDIRDVPWEGEPDKEIEAFVSEELYVHSKLLIADDSIAICGSANLNDRSQLGDHDSEIAVIIDDPTPLPSRMNGRRYTASHFAATLRRQIFRKHLGLIPAQDLSQVDENMMPIPVPNIYDFDSAEDRLVEDPLSDQFWDFWNRTAKINTDAFARVFHTIPHDSITNWKMYEEYWSKHFVAPKQDPKPPKDAEAPAPKEKWGHVVRSEFSPGRQGAREVKEVLASIRGHLVEMPLNFLKEEDIAKEGLGLNAITETLYT